MLAVTNPLVKPFFDINDGLPSFFFIDSETVFRSSHSPRPITRISDYLNERPIFPEPYVPPSSKRRNSIAD